MKLCRKINLMHKLFGISDGNKCKNCSHLVDNGYYKCEVYGVTDSEASDWRLKYDACGLFCKPCEERNVIQMVRRMNIPQEEPLEGQIDFNSIALDNTKE